MGKNRSKSNSTYTTEEGYDVDTGRHTTEFMQKLEDHIAHWLWRDYNSTNIIYHMSEDEINYLINHMQSSESDTVPTGHLTRIEYKYHASGLKEGDVIEGTIYSVHSVGILVQQIAYLTHIRNGVMIWTIL